MEQQPVPQSPGQLPDPQLRVQLRQQLPELPGSRGQLPKLPEPRGQLLEVPKPMGQLPEGALGAAPGTTATLPHPALGAVAVQPLPGKPARLQSPACGTCPHQWNG